MDTMIATTVSPSNQELLERLDAEAAQFLNSPLLERFSVRSIGGGVHTEVRVIEIEDKAAELPLPPA